VRFGEVVRERRTELGLSQEDLAERCGFAEIGEPLPRRRRRR